MEVELSFWGWGKFYFLHHCKVKGGIEKFRSMKIHNKFLKLLNNSSFYLVFSRRLP